MGDVAGAWEVRLEVHLYLSVGLVFGKGWDRVRLGLRLGWG